MRISKSLIISFGSTTTDSMKLFAPINTGYQPQCRALSAKRLRLVPIPPLALSAIRDENAGVRIVRTERSQTRFDRTSFGRNARRLQMEANRARGSSRDVSNEKRVTDSIKFLQSLIIVSAAPIASRDYGYSRINNCVM